LRPSNDLHPRMGGDIKYNFYHSDGGGRDGFIRHVSEHQTSFNYVPKAPEFVGTRMPGMASNMTGNMSMSTYKERPMVVVGYTGHSLPPGGPGQPTPPDAFPGLPVGGGAPVPMPNLVSSFHVEKRRHEAKIQTPNYRIPGYAGHCSGHQHVCGFTHGAVCWGDAGRTDLAAIGPGAPGEASGPQVIHQQNLQKGAFVPDCKPKTKQGYTGHLHGRHYSSNYGEAYAVTADKLLLSSTSGRVINVGEFPGTDSGNRPMRQKVAISGYSGFRPRTTPDTFA